MNRVPASARRAARSRPRRRSLLVRRFSNLAMSGILGLAAVLATLPLVLILVHLLREGAAAVNLDFFTQIPRPVGESGGGMKHAIVGTLVLVGIAATIGLPVGVGAGLYLAEHRRSRLATMVRFLADVLNGLPSIVMGIFAWQFLVRPVGHFSAYAGGVALGAMMIPLVTRATEEMVRTVPDSLREAALALGYPRWRTSLAIVLRTAMPGIVTAALVAVARIAGESAPLLFTALGNNFLSFALDEPIHALPLQIFFFAIQPYESSHQLAWAGALVLISMVLLLSTVARAVVRSRHGGGRTGGGVGD